MLASIIMLMVSVFVIMVAGFGAWALFKVIRAIWRAMVNAAVEGEREAKRRREQKST